MRNLEFIAEIHGGVPIPPAEYRKFLQHQDGKRARISLGWNTKKRSTRQNSFYFGPVIQCVREWLKEQGYNFDATETHEFIVRHIWKWTEVTMIDGVPYEKRLSSTRLSSIEWEEKIELVRQYGAEHDFMVPYPHEAIA